MTDIKVSEILEKAADLIEPEGRWTQDSLYRDANGEATACSTDASCYCMAGALAVSGGAWQEAWDYLERSLPGIMNGKKLVEFNDEPFRTQEEVVTVLRQTADMARAEGK